MNVVLGVTGSIAAYKACELVRLLVKRGDDVHVVMTEHARAFVTPLTFQTLSRNPVERDLFDDPQDWKPGHVSLAASADLVVVAPATANILAKMAHGIADDLLSATLLATKAQIVVAPAMNSGMWESPVTPEAETVACKPLPTSDFSDSSGSSPRRIWKSRLSNESRTRIFRASSSTEDRYFAPTNEISLTAPT